MIEVKERIYYPQVVIIDSLIVSVVNVVVAEEVGLAASALVLLQL